MKKYRRKRQTRLDPVLTTCRHFIHQLGLKATDLDLFDSLGRAANEQNLVIFVEQHSQGFSFRLVNKDEANAHLSKG